MDCLDGSSQKMCHVPTQRHLDGLIEGENEAMPRGDWVKKSDVQATMTWMVESINRAVGSEKQTVEVSNQKLLASFCKDEISADALARGWKQAPDEIKTKDFKRMASKFVSKNKFTKQKPNTSGNYLQFDDVKMVELLGLFDCCVLLVINNISKFLSAVPCRWRNSTQLYLFGHLFGFCSYQLQRCYKEPEEIQIHHRVARNSASSCAQL